MSINEDIARQIRKLKRRVNVTEAKPAPLNLEGTYVPTYLGGTTAGVTTYSFQDGAWKRVGNTITVRGQVSWTAATGTGNAQVSLPFAPVGGNFGGSLYLSAVTFAAGTPLMLISAGNLFFTMGSPATNVNPTIVAIEAAGSIIWTVTYFVA